MAALEAALERTERGEAGAVFVAGSGLEFADRGSRALAGVPGEWRLLAVVDHDRGAGGAPVPSELLGPIG